MLAGKELGAHLPVYLYGAAHPQQRSLAALRRDLKYFQGSPLGVPRAVLHLALQM